MSLFQCPVKLNKTFGPLDSLLFQGRQILLSLLSLNKFLTSPNLIQKGGGEVFGNLLEEGA